MVPLCTICSYNLLISYLKLEKEKPSWRTMGSIALSVPLLCLQSSNYRPGQSRIQALGLSRVEGHSRLRNHRGEYGKPQSKTRGEYGKQQSRPGEELRQRGELVTQTRFPLPLTERNLLFINYSDVFL